MELTPCFCFLSPCHLLPAVSACKSVSYLKISGCSIDPSAGGAGFGRNPADKKMLPNDFFTASMRGLKALTKCL
jgi:hypothetical protein